ncbi:MAG: hypothetical protein EOO04_33405 [Chitinophagaceae bacterium]|nr:MAG: hypothetical protein EOO04_33405 [Chitinophagaceae bacterium]
MKGKMILWLGLSVLFACKSMEVNQIDLIKSGIVVHVADTTIKAHVHEGKVDANLEYTYFWFDKGHINSSQGSYSGKLLHGHFKSYHSQNKKLLTSGMIEHGLKTGKWLRWYENGNLKQRTDYKNGLLDGSAVLYDSSGKPTDTLKYRNGLLRVKTTDTIGIYNKIKRFLNFRKR